MIMINVYICRLGAKKKCVLQLGQTKWTNRFNLSLSIFLMLHFMAINLFLK